MFDRVLIANRGEIAVRVIRTLRSMGVAAAAVYTASDRGALHIDLADDALLVPSYLDPAALVAAATAVGAEAVHPGYGFLSENAAFARAVASAGLVFIGPPAEAIELMGDKINAKRAVAASGVPVVPGRDEQGLDDSQLAAAALEVGLPVLLKPSAGGGGKGMRLVTAEGELAGSIEAARREAVAAFGDGTLLVERFLSRPRHIEMQVFADRHGGCVALGERECSLQRRHQKIVEEAPSPFLEPGVRAAMSESAVAAARACGYVGAGTVEFIVSADRPDDYFFMEMNTRLQVEHPVTEMVLGVDLVEWQVRVAAGEPLPWPDRAELPQAAGHAVEARLYAEDPARGFLPSSGRVLALEEPDGMEGVRVDSGLRAGLEVGTAYDPMLAKVVAWGPDRRAALRRLDAALAGTTILGVTTNIGFLRQLIATPEVVAGTLDTGLVERRMVEWQPPGIPDTALVAASLGLGSDPAAAAGDPWTVADGWRVSGAGGRVVAWRIGADTVRVEAVAAGRAGPGSAVVRVDGRELGPVRAWSPEPGRIAVEMDGRRWVYAWAVDGDDVWVGGGGDAWRLTQDRLSLVHRGGSGHGADRVTSPMPGTVLAVRVAPGQAVVAGEELIVVEAMKMEHAVRAGAEGTVAEVLVRVGDPVRLDQPLLVMDGAEEPGGRQ